MKGITLEEIRVIRDEMDEKTERMPNEAILQEDSQKVEDFICNYNKLREEKYKQQKIA